MTGVGGTIWMRCRRRRQRRQYEQNVGGLDRRAPVRDGAWAERGRNVVENLQGIGFINDH